jgi:outer membrane protein assembly factor BamB
MHTPINESKNIAEEDSDAVISQDENSSNGVYIIPSSSVYNTPTRDQTTAYADNIMGDGAIILQTRKINRNVDINVKNIKISWSIDSLRLLSLFLTSYLQPATTTSDGKILASNFLDSEDSKNLRGDFDEHYNPSIAVCDPHMPRIVHSGPLALRCGDCNSREMLHNIFKRLVEYALCFVY